MQNDCTLYLIHVDILYCKSVRSILISYKLRYHTVYLFSDHVNSKSVVFIVYSLYNLILQSCDPLITYQEDFILLSLGRSRNKFFVSNECNLTSYNDIYLYDHSIE